MMNGDKVKQARILVLQHLQKVDEASLQEITEYVNLGDFSISRSRLGDCLRAMVLCDELETRKQSRSLVYRILMPAGKIEELPKTEKTLEATAHEPIMQSEKDKKAQEASYTLAPDSVLALNDIEEGNLSQEAMVTVGKTKSDYARRSHSQPVPSSSLHTIPPELPPPVPLNEIPPGKASGRKSLDASLHDLHQIGSNLDREIAQAEAELRALEEEKKKLSDIETLQKENEAKKQRLQTLRGEIFKMGCGKTPKPR